MFHHIHASVASRVAAVVIAGAVSSWANLRSGTYQITSGSYKEIGGIVGSITYELPYRNQAFALLSINDDLGTADLAFLTPDLRPSLIQLSNGVVAGDCIRFQYETGHPWFGLEGLRAEVDYTVTNIAGTLWVNGSIVAEPVCCDIAYFFGHQDVQLVLVPEPAATTLGALGIWVLGVLGRGRLRRGNTYG